jgi:hypothetical protein
MRKSHKPPAVYRASHVTFKCGMYAEDVQSPADMERGTPRLLYHGRALFVIGPINPCSRALATLACNRAGVANFPINRIAELTPAAWLARN